MLIDWFTVAAQASNFLILVWLLKRFLYKPVLAAMAARETKIATELQGAAAAKAQARKERADFEAQNVALQQQRSELLRKAADDAASQRQALLDEARKDSQELRSKLNEAANTERAALNRDILTRIRQEVFAMTRKTLADLADTRLEDRVVDAFLGRLHGMNDTQKAEVSLTTRVLSAEALPATAAVPPALLRSAFELSPAQRATVEAALGEWLCPGTKLKYETSPELISGLELIVGGRKTAWNVTEYLASLEQDVTALLEPPAQAPAAAATDVRHVA
jgi:F-type H+-transporting ATPase subunit b